MGLYIIPELETDDLCLISNKVIPNSFICAVMGYFKVGGKHYIIKVIIG